VLRSGRLHEMATDATDLSSDVEVSYKSGIRDNALAVHGRTFRYCAALDEHAFFVEEIYDKKLALFVHGKGQSGVRNFVSSRHRRIVFPQVRRSLVQLLR